MSHLGQKTSCPKIVTSGAKCDLLKFRYLVFPKTTNTNWYRMFLGLRDSAPLLDCMQSKSTAGYQSSSCRQRNGVRVKMTNFRVKLKSSGTTRQMFCPWIPIRGWLPVILQAPDAMSARLTALMCIFVYFSYSYSLKAVDLIISMAGSGQRGGFNISGKISHLTASTASTGTLQRWRH